MPPSVTSIFVSAVSKEFGSYRREVASALRERGYHTKTQDEFSTGPGTLLEKLDAFIRRCDAVVCLIGDRFGAEPKSAEVEFASGTRNSYTQHEYLLARKYGKPTYVFFPADPRTPRDHENDESDELAALQREFWNTEIVSNGIDRTPFSDHASLVRAVLVCEFPQANRPAGLRRGPIDVSCPFVGLKRFEEKDREYFYGRTAAMNRVGEQIRSAPLTLLTGNSGSGKSSLLRAGVIPSWIREQKSAGFLSPQVIVLTPGNSPFERFWAALASTGFEDDAVGFTRTPNPTVFRDFAEALPVILGSTQPLFILVDQFEEVFTRLSEHDSSIREMFISAVVDFAEFGGRNDSQSETGSIPRFRIVLAMRDDFFGDLRDHRNLFALTDKNLERVVAMEREELREAIEVPAALHGVRFEDGLVDRLIAAVEGRAGMLPMLQFTLEALWLRERDHGSLESGFISARSYREIGGVEGALQKRVSSYYLTKSEEEKRSIRNILLSLVEPDMGSESLPVSRASSKEALLSIGGEKILRELLDKEKLLISEGRENESIVELAHEALIKAWPEFASWVNESREAIRIRNQLREDGGRWAERDEAADDELWRGSRLERAIELEKEGEFERIGGLTLRDRLFLAASERQKYREVRKARLLAGTASIVAMVALILLYVAYENLKRANLEIANAWKERALRYNNEGDYFGATLMAAKGLGFIGYGRDRADPDFRTQHKIFLDSETSSHIETEEHLRSIARESCVQVPFWQSGGHKARIVSLAWNDDGTTLASGDEDGGLAIWRQAQPLFLMVARPTAPEAIHRVSWSPDGQLLLAAFGTNSLALFDKDGRKKTIGKKVLDVAKISTISWRSDSKSFAIGLSSGDDVSIFIPGENVVRSIKTAALGVVDLDWNGEMLFITCNNGEVLVWNDEKIEISKLSQDLQGVYSLQIGDRREIQMAAFSDGHFLRKVGERFEVVGTPLNPEGKSCWSPSFDSVSLVDPNGDVYLWSNGDSVKVEPPAESCTGGPVWSPNGSYFACCGVEGAVCVWGTSGSLIRFVENLHPAKGTLVWSPDSNSLTFGCKDGSIMSYEIASGILRQTTTHRSPVVHVAWSPDDKVLASVDFDGSIKLFRHPEGTCRFVIPARDELPPVISWSRRNCLGVGRDDGTIEIRSDSGELLAKFDGGRSKVIDLAWCKSGNLLATVSRDGRSIIWDLSGKRIREFAAPSGKIVRGAWSPEEDDVVFGSSEGHFLIWRSKDSETLNVQSEFRSEVTALTWRPGGSSFSAGFRDGHFEVRDRATGKLVDRSVLRSDTKHNNRVADIAWNPKGGLVATSSWDNSIKIWNAEGKEIAQCIGHLRGVPTIGWSPDGEVLASGSWDESVIFWDRYGRRESHIRAFNDAVNRIAWSGDATQLAVASGDRCVRVFSTGVSEGLDMACFLQKKWLAIDEGEYDWMSPFQNPSANSGWYRVLFSERIFASELFFVSTEPIRSLLDTGSVFGDSPGDLAPWVFPGSDRTRTPTELIHQLSDDDLWEARNEIYARKGLIFGSSRGMDYMGKFSQGYYFPASTVQDTIQELFSPAALHNVNAFKIEQDTRELK